MIQENAKPAAPMQPFVQRSVYANEFDQHAAHWLNQLITEGLIPNGHVDTRSIKEVSPADVAGYVKQSIQVLRVYTSYGQGERDMSGTVPKPSRATCNYGRFSNFRFARIRAYGQRRERDALRMTRKILERADYACEIGLNYCRAVVSLSSFGGTVALAVDFSYATREQSSQHECDDIQGSKFVFDLRLLWHKTLYHRLGTTSACPCPLGAVSSGRRHHTCQSKIDCLFGSMGIRSDSDRNFLFSLTQNTKYYGWNQ